MHWWWVSGKPECGMDSGTCVCHPNTRDNSNVKHSLRTVYEIPIISICQTKIGNTKKKVLLWAHLHDVHRSWAEAANTYYTPRSGRNCFGHQCDKCRIHHSDIGPCLHHRTDCKLNTWTAKKDKIDGNKTERMTFWMAQKMGGEYDLTSIVHSTVRHLPFRISHRTSRIQLVLFAAYHTPCKLIPLTFSYRNGDPRFHRGNIDNWRISRSKASKCGGNERKKIDTKLELVGMSNFHVS